MSGRWLIKVKMVTGNLQDPIAVDDPQGTTVLQLKNLIHQKLSHAQPHLQKLYVNYRAGSGTLLKDGDYLALYPSLESGPVVLIIATPWELCVHDHNQRIHTITVPSSTPETYTIVELRKLIEKQLGFRMNELQLQHNSRPLEECRHGKNLTLKDYGIKKSDNVFVTKIGFIFNLEKKLDICFMMDCTASMCSHIEAVKANIKKIRDDLATKYKGCKIRFAFVRYTDFDQPQSTRITYLNFTEALSAFHSFVDPLQGIGGGDGPEDIMGAFKTTFSNLSWETSECSKVLFHIADAPCHGTQYHNDAGDSYPHGDPNGITHDQMMQEVVRLDIQYWFGYINKDYTDKMVRIFNDTLQSLSDHRLMIRQFNIKDPQEITDAIIRSVEASMQITAARKVIREISTTLDISIPIWDSLPINHGVKTPPPGPKSLQNLQDGLTLDKPSVPIAIKIAPNPFTDGEESYIYRGYDTLNKRQVVLKKFKASGATLDCHMKVLEIQTIASTYARDFNNDKKKPCHVESIEFIPADVIQINDGSLYILQPFIDGKFEKYNTNNGIVCTAATNSDMMQAFSHFTYVHSGESLLICDLQGVRNSRGVNQLSDPAIHCRIRQRTYGNTDSGFLGIRRFFNSHNCNNICRSMGLDGVRA